MKPYYEDPLVVIYHADCAEILDDLPEIDLVITDPPYGMNWRSNQRKYDKHDYIAGDGALPVEMIKRLIDRARCGAYFFCRWDNLQELPPPKSFLAWVKNHFTAGDLDHSHGRMWEGCAFYPGPEHKFIKRVPDVIQAPRVVSDLHPTEKPTKVMATLISANEGNLILDPYAGSGTTGRAAKDLGRKCIQVEIEEKYCEVAASRLLQENLF